jgi:hypothetical protein
MRRISTTTRWLAAAGVGCVVALSVFFAGRATSSSGAATVQTPVTAAPAPTTAPTANGAGSGSVATPPVTYAPPQTYPPVRHTQSRGS